MKKLQLVSFLFSLILINSLYATSSYQINSTADLWQVAGQMRTDATVTRQQILLGLLQTNPDVFIYPCNVFSIKLGSSVNVPDEATLQQIDRISAIQQIGQQILAWDDHLSGRATLPCEAVINTAETSANTETVAPVETATPAPSTTETAPEASTTPTETKETSAEKPANNETVAPAPSTTEIMPAVSATPVENSVEKPINNEVVAPVATSATPAPITTPSAAETDKTTVAVKKEVVALKPYTPAPFKPATPPSEVTTEETPFAQVLTQITQFFTVRSNEQFTDKQQYYLKQMFLFLFYAFILAFVLRLIFIIKRYFRQQTEKRLMLKKQAIIQPI
ncbi:FimV N-terminal domain protein [Beggiatoa alba B18LD]|uniref:FimV N-terminal domain protein n=1 Tax=Beggiatoa alba B18LD TaxID=395493 RepID=I3CDD8_9GAMM|nr:FimV/HubP family polar landmark protein [Beggiatoa alba]EIJ41631.1 FimV N-terminal domain protein [Beggiatoa alba B18LD]